jgi:hypothetical protein
MNIQEIHNICKRYYIGNYSINPDGSIDVDGDVDLSYKNLDRIPIKFGVVTGMFYCNNNNLTSLENCPNEIKSWFNCSYNKLRSLSGISNFKNVIYYCVENPLESLNGFEGHYNIIYCDNKEILVNKHKRSKKLKLIENI